MWCEEAEGQSVVFDQRRKKVPSPSIPPASGICPPETCSHRAASLGPWAKHIRPVSFEGSRLARGDVEWRPGSTVVAWPASLAVVAKMAFSLVGGLDQPAETAQ